MRVTVEHGTYTDTLGANRGYRVTLGVIFTEEEKAIIRLRNLTERFFTVRAADPVPSKTLYIGIKAVRTITTYMIIAGFGVAIYSAVTHAGDGVASFLILGGIILKVVAYIQDRKNEKH